MHPLLLIVIVVVVIWLLLKAIDEIGMGDVGNILKFLVLVVAAWFIGSRFLW